MLNENPSEERINQHISAMNDSVALLNEEIAKEYDELQVLRIQANIDHLKIMLQKDYIINHESDKTIFNNAITNAENFLLENK